MARVSPIITAFNAGELSPQLYGRVDVAKYASGCRKMENFVPLVHGPAVRRPGTMFVSAVKDSAKKVRLIPFEFSVTQAYVLEFGDQYIRFYANNSRLMSGGAPYEITTPYFEEDLPEIKYAQDADTMYIVHPLHAPRKLTRTGDVSWTLSVVDFHNGPYLDEQDWIITGNNLCPNGSMEADSSWASVGTPSVNARSAEKYAEGAYSRKFTADASTGGIKSNAFTTVTGKCYRVTFRVYTANNSLGVDISNGANTGWVSGLSLWAVPVSEWKEYTIFYMETAGGSGAYIQFTSGTLTTGTWYIDDVRIYEMDGGLVWFSTRTGTGVAMYSSAALFTADHVGSLWRIRHPFTTNDSTKGPTEEGFVKVTAYVSTTQVTVDVVGELSDYKPTPNFSEGAFSLYRGYPAAISLHKQCMWIACTPDFPQRLWRSVVASYEDFSPGNDANDGFSYTIASEKVNSIRWLASATSLIIGTNNGEWTLGPANSNSSLSPSNVEANQQSAFGGANLEPINLRTSILFVCRLGNPGNAGETIRELSYRYDVDGYVGVDLTLLAEHVGRGGILSWAVMSAPHSIVWACRSDGTLLGLTYEKDQEVYAWHRHPMSGFVESVCVIPGAYQDVLYMVVRRNVGGVDVRYVEYMADFDPSAANKRTPGFSGSSTSPYFVDCGIRYSGVPVTVVTGLSHLAGKTVQILRSGAVVPDQVVSAGGTVTLDVESGDVVAGLKYVSELIPMDIEAGALEGTAQGKRKRIHEVAVKLYETIGGKIGWDESNLDEIITRDLSDPIGSAPSLFTGDYDLPFPGGYDTTGRMIVRQDLPFPMTVLCLMPRLDTQDR